MHPGRLTHYHEGLKVTNNTRYIMVSFVDPWNWSNFGMNNLFTLFNEFFLNLLVIIKLNTFT